MEERIEEVLGTSKDLDRAIKEVLGVSVETFFEKEENKGKVFISVDSSPVEKIGLLNFIVKKITIGSFGSIYITSKEEEEETKIRASFSLNVSYTYQDSGSNGCYLGLGGKKILMQLKKDFWTKQYMWEGVIF